MSGSDLSSVVSLAVIDAAPRPPAAEPVVESAASSHPGHWRWNGLRRRECLHESDWGSPAPARVTAQELAALEAKEARLQHELEEAKRSPRCLRITSHSDPLQHDATERQRRETLRRLLCAELHRVITTLLMQWRAQQAMERTAPCPRLTKKPSVGHAR